MLVWHFLGQGTIQNVTTNVQNTKEHVLDKFSVQLTRQNLLKHEKMKNGTPSGLADKSVPARNEY